MSLTADQALKLLPSVPTKSLRKPERLKYFCLAEPKWGKTTLFSGINNCLLLAFEEGHAFVEAKKIIIDKWDTDFRTKKNGGSWSEDGDGNTHSTAIETIEALEAIAANGDLPYEFILVDTADMASKMCTDHHCSEAGVEHPADGGDFGKGWDLLQTSPFRRWFGRLVKLGVGLACTSHIKVTEDPKQKGKFKRESTLPSGIQRFIHTQADVIINGSFGRLRKGQQDRDRIISFDGSNDVLAGSRIRGAYLPKKYIVEGPTVEDQSIPWKQWCKFFEDDNYGKEAERQYNLLINGRDDEHVAAVVPEGEGVAETPAEVANAAAKMPKKSLKSKD